MNNPKLENGITSHNATVRGIMGIRSSVGTPTANRIIAITAIINASQLTTDQIDDPAVIEEIIGITSFVSEEGVSKYIHAHLNSTDFPIHPVLLAIYHKNAVSSSDSITLEKATTIEGIMTDSSK